VVYNYEGYVTITGTTYTGLGEITKGANVSSVTVINSSNLLITYTSAANALPNTSTYTITLTPNASLQNSGPSRFYGTIGLPLSYTAGTLPIARAGHLGGVIDATIPSSYTTAAFASLSLPAGVWVVTYGLYFTTSSQVVVTLSYNNFMQTTPGSAGTYYQASGSYIVSATSTQTCQFTAAPSGTIDASKSYHRAVRIA
jgi:hypothetical protein